MDNSVALNRLKNTERNAPCPCGSGKKYKICHYVEDKAIELEASKLKTKLLEEEAKLEAEKAQAEGGATESGAAKSAKVTKSHQVKEHIKASSSRGGNVSLPRKVGGAG